MHGTGTSAPDDDALVALIERHVQHAVAEREAVLQSRIAELEATVAGLTPGSAGPPRTMIEVRATTDESDSGVSRRRLMRIVGTGAAVGVAVVGATVAGATPAAAAANNPLLIGANNDGAATITALNASPGPNSATFAATNTNGDRPIGVYGVAGPVSGTAVEGGAVVGNSQDQYGVVGLSSTTAGVYGSSANSYGVQGYGNKFLGVYGYSYSNTGVYGYAGTGAGAGIAGVKGDGNDCPGVLGASTRTHGVVGLAQGSSLSNFTTSGLLGQATSGRGVTGAVTSGTGVVGQASTGMGVQGISTSTGVAGQFSGGRAQLYLVPSTTAGAPTSGTHKIGELFLDKAGALYVCKTAGTPGTWKLLG